MQTSPMTKHLSNIIVFGPVSPEIMRRQARHFWGGHLIRNRLNLSVQLPKRIAISGSVFWAPIHFCSTSTDAVHLSRLPSWLHWYMCCIVSWVTPHFGQRLVVACPRRCRIVIVGRVFLMHFMMKCSMWAVVISRARLNNVRSISSQSTVWVRFRPYQCWSRQRLYICYVINWVMLEWMELRV